RSLVLRHGIRQITIDTARTIVGSVHTCARHCFVAVHQVFTFTECVQEHRHCTDVQRVSTDPHQVVQDTGDFVEHDADVLRAQRHIHTEQTLDRHDITVFVTHHRHVVETVHVRHGLQIGFLFCQLLGCAMQQTDMRVSTLNHFAVQLENQTQHAVCCRVLRTEVQRVVLDFGHYFTPYCSSRITRGTFSRGSMVTG